MKRDSRLSMSLHLLVHLSEADEELTSTMLAAQGGTNPAVIRRTLGGLRDAGLLEARRGRGGGWALARPAHEITLRQIYDALGTPSVFAMGNRTESPGCLVEQAVNHVMSEAFADAEAVLMARLESVTLADISTDVLQRHRRTLDS